MKTLCSFMAWLCTAGFCMLVAAAIFDMAFMHQRLHIELPLPKLHENHQNVQAFDMLDRDCMARNIFFEARGESAKGKSMVGFVVLERTKSPHFPSSICGVVNQANTDAQGKIIKFQCAFSWVCDGKNHSEDFSDPRLKKEWEESQAVAELVLSGKLKPPVDMRGVTHYYASRIKFPWPQDRKNFKLVATVGNHLFFRWSKAQLPKLDLASR